MNLQFLSNTTLFRGLQTDEIRSVLTCINAQEKSYRKGEVLCRAGESVSSMGMVLSGSANIVVNYYWGGSNIFGHVGPGELFAESYAAIPGRELLADVIADEPTEVLFLPFLRLTETCAQSCPFHNRVIHNLLQIMARKNLHLSVRMMHTASRSIRNRLLSYLSEQAVQNGSSQFTIPFSRYSARFVLTFEATLSAATFAISCSTISCTSCSKLVVCGFHPSLAFAFVGSPHRFTTSVGR